MPTRFQFDATNVTPDQGRGDPLPAGWYAAQIVDSEIKAASSGQGNYYLALVFEVLGKNVGRKVFCNLNIRHENELTQKIAEGQLSAILHAINHVVIREHTGELHGKPMKIKLKVTQPVKDEQGNVKYDAKNEIIAFKSYNDVVPMADENDSGQGASAAPPPGFGYASPSAAPPPQAPAPSGSAPPQPPSPSAAPTPNQPWGNAPQPWTAAPQEGQNGQGAPAPQAPTTPAPPAPAPAPAPVPPQEPVQPPAPAPSAGNPPVHKAPWEQD